MMILLFVFQFDFMCKDYWSNMENNFINIDMFKVINNERYSVFTRQSHVT